MRTHVCQTVSRCFAALRQLRSIRHLVSATVFQSLVTALVLSRLDYGNADRPADPPYLSPSVCAECCGTTDISSPKFDHITDALISLHWLRVPERIVFKVAVQTYQGTAR